MKKAEPVKPRNGHIARIRTRRAGAHGKTRKAERRGAKVRMTKETRDGCDEARAFSQPSPAG